jgi:hypothetical protein
MNTGPSLRKRFALAVPPLRRVVDERDELRRRQWPLERMLAMEQRRTAELERHLAEIESGSSPAANGVPTQLGYLFVVTYGRSGSTLLQGILNSIPGYLIRGENRAVVYRLYEFHSSLLSARGEFARPADLTSRDSWFGIDEYAASLAVSRMRALVLDTVLRPQPDTRVIGFKEIRWWQRDWQGYLAFMQQLFPGARFVLNTRNHMGVAKSKWWADEPEQAVLAKLAQHEAQLDAMAASLGPNAYRVHYDEYMADPRILAGLFDWLGAPFDLAAIDSVLDMKHSF